VIAVPSPPYRPIPLDVHEIPRRKRKLVERSDERSRRGSQDRAVFGQPPDAGDVLRTAAI
jgi:hypothetical protein